MKGRVILGLTATALLATVAFLGLQDNSQGETQSVSGPALLAAWSGDTDLQTCAATWQPGIEAFSNYHPDGCNRKYGLYLESNKSIIPINSQLKELKIHFSSLPTADGYLALNYNHAAQWVNVATQALNQWASIEINQPVKTDNILLLWQENSTCYGAANNPCPSIDQIAWAYNQ